MAKAKEKQENRCLSPAFAVGGCIVRSGSKKMVSCPDPVNCPGNLRSMWHGNEEAAIVEWNNLVAEDRRTRA